MDFKYSIENISPEPEDIDDEIIFFNFDVCYTAPTEETISGFIPFHRLKEYLRQRQPSLYDFIESTRTSLDLWGPAEASTLEAMGEEAMAQLQEHLLAYMEETNYAQLHYEWWQNLQKPRSSERTHEIATDLGSLIEESRDTMKRSRAFCQKAERSVREIAIEIYPEIADLDPEKLLKFKNLFVNQIVEMQERIHTLLNNKIDD